MVNKALTTVQNPPDGYHTTELEAWVNERARFLGMTPGQLREYDLLGAAEMEYPTAECLDPSEIEQIFSDRITDQQRQHLSECAMCAALADASNPPLRWFDELLDATALSEPASMASGPRRRFSSSLVAGAVGVIVFACVTYLYLSSRSDALMSVLVRERAWTMARDLAGCVLVLALVAFVFGRYVLSANARRTGATITVALFSAVVAVLFGSDYSAVVNSYDAMSDSQMAVLRKWGDDLKRTGRAPTMLTEKAPGILPGSIVAIATDNGSAEVHWERPVKTWVEATKGENASRTESDPLGKIIEGKMRRSDDGSQNVQTKAGESIKVSSTASGPQVSDGANVVAFVRARTMDASKIYAVDFAQK